MRALENGTEYRKPGHVRQSVRFNRDFDGLFVEVGRTVTAGIQSEPLVAAGNQRIGRGLLPVITAENGEVEQRFEFAPLRLTQPDARWKISLKTAQLQFLLHVTGKQTDA